MSTSYTFAQNESISPRQLYRLYVFNLLGVGTLVLPNNLAKLGKYGFISIALGVFMAWLFMWICLLYTSPSPRDGLLSRMPSSA